jgi:hypothetical protein
MIPVLYVSAHPESRGPSEAAPSLPSGRYLTEPFERARLLGEVQLALDEQS